MSCSAVCFLWWVRWGQLAELRGRRLFVADLTHADWRVEPCMQQQRYIHTSFGGFPCQMFALTQPTACFEQRACFHHHAHALLQWTHLPSNNQHTFICIVFASQEVIIHCAAAAINSRQQENSGRNSQLMITKWQLASPLHRAEQRGCLFPDKYEPQTCNYNKLFYWLWFWLIICPGNAK